MGQGEGRGKSPIGISPVIGPEIPGLGAAPADDSSSPEPPGNLWQQDSRVLEAVLEAAVIVVNFLEIPHFRREEPVFLKEIQDRLVVKVGADPSGHDHVEKVSGSEMDPVSSEQILLEASELGESESEAGIVAERS